MREHPSRCDSWSAWIHGKCMGASRNELIKKSIPNGASLINVAFWLSFMSVEDFWILRPHSQVETSLLEKSKSIDITCLVSSMPGFDPWSSQRRRQYTAKEPLGHSSLWKYKIKIPHCRNDQFAYLKMFKNWIWKAVAETI